MIKHLLYLLLISIVISCQPNEDKHLKIIFTGDVILDRGIEDELNLHGDELLVKSLSSFNQQDFLVVNLEGTFSDQNLPSITKSKYQFKTPSYRASILQKAGITHASVANNHSWDFGQPAFQTTVHHLNNNNISPLGTTNVPNIISKGKYKCAILAASLSSNNENFPISDIESLKSSVKKFTLAHPKIPLIIYIHWGLEMQPTPKTWQRELAKELIHLGTDAIIGHHPHTTQTIEFIDGKPIFYSLGNFIADAYLPQTDQSYVVELNITDRIKDINILPINLKTYFPKLLSLTNQIKALKKHVEHSNISLLLNGEKWRVQENYKTDFSEDTKLWMIADNYTISTIKAVNDSSYLWKFEQDGTTTNIVNLHGSLSEYKIGDINNDGETDILFGISKKVKFDPIKKKRINIYTFKDNAIKPLWLGTKFINDVKSFDIQQHNHLNYLITTEYTSPQKTIKRIYEWDDFGFSLTEKNKN